MTGEKDAVERPLGDDEILIWTEAGGPIMMRAVTAAGDPVELNEVEARRVVDVLARLAGGITEE